MAELSRALLSKQEISGSNLDYRLQTTLVPRAFLKFPDTQTEMRALWVGMGKRWSYKKCNTITRDGGTVFARRNPKIWLVELNVLGMLRIYDTELSLLEHSAVRITTLPDIASTEPAFTDHPGSGSGGG
ncbi:hypothetical protein EVAR_81890_1 [Eumeta japonica]|uniref:Uncharacterized protein n=1 Tax=Eumeta variegata TaxID=151549 RepID=A0A4C1UYG3_EUMVA|nr:hypothetical protein EVAR_81890_1 [Eumeta japonica]